MIQNNNSSYWFATENTTKIRIKCVQVRRNDKSENKYIIRK